MTSLAVDESCGSINNTGIYTKLARGAGLRSAPEDVTQLLIEMRAGSGEAEAKVLELVYRELRRIAASCLRKERPDHSLQATALVHEAYIRIARPKGIEWRNRAHFFAVAARVMRGVLVDYARARKASKRGGAPVRIDLPESMMVSDHRNAQVLGVDEALTRLAQFDARQSQIVEMRFFGGLTEEEIAEVLGLSVRTVKRDWSLARAWLYGELKK